MIVSKSDLSARVIAVQSPDWLLQTGQRIQALDYELHAAIRTIGKGEMRPDHIPAFMNASGKRDELMAQVISYLAEQSKRSKYHSSPESTAKPEG